MGITRIAKIVQCPLCKGLKQDYSAKHHTMMECPLCRDHTPMGEARGWVPTESCKSCGRPAFCWWPNDATAIIRYCGAEVCRKALIKVTTIEQVMANAESEEGEDYAAEYIRMQNMY
jgi:hypothetical protein